MMNTKRRRQPVNDERPIDVLLVLDYYTPYVSGLTNVARDLAEDLAARGLRVVVVTARHENSLPRDELLNGVEIVRTRVLGRVDRASLSPEFVRMAIRLGRRARIVNLHLPMPEAAAIAIGVPRRTPVVVTYQCDPPAGLGLKSDLLQRALDASHKVALRRASHIVVSSEDYADSSRVLNKFSSAARTAIPPTAWGRPAGSPSYRVSGGRHVGFLGRLTSEKGTDVLIRAFRTVAAPTDRLLIAGEGVDVAGDSAIEVIKGAADGDPRIVFLGRLPDSAISDFYASIDVLSLPSTNSFEAFGIVQVEALLAGVPVIASNLPGVRTPVELTGAGIIVEPRDVDALAAALRAIVNLELTSSEIARRAEEHYAARYSLDAYLELFTSLSGGFIRTGKPDGPATKGNGHG